MAQELPWDLNQAISHRLPAAKIFRSLKTFVDYAQPHHQEAFAELFVDRVYFVQKGEPSPAAKFARDILARAQTARSGVLQEVRWFVAKIIGQPEPVVIGGPTDSGTSNESGSRPSDDTSARYAEAGISKWQITSRELEKAISTLEGNREAQEVLDWAVRQYLIRLGGQIPDGPRVTPDINIKLKLDVKELYGGVHFGHGGGSGGNSGGNGKGKGGRFRALSRAVRNAIQTLAAATVLVAFLSGISVEPAELTPEDIGELVADISPPIVEPHAAEWRYATVNAEGGLNVREGASIEADEIGAIRQGRLVEVQAGADADFVLVRYGDENGETRLGYVAREYLQFVP